MKNSLKIILIILFTSPVFAETSVSCGAHWCTTNYGTCNDGVFIAGAGNPQDLNGNECTYTGTVFKVSKLKNAKQLKQKKEVDQTIKGQALKGKH